jgi:hypothetical protein
MRPDELTDDVTLDDGTNAPAPKPRRVYKSARLPRKRYHRFVSGPIPLQWICDAEGLGGSALFVGMALWHYAGLNHSLKFRAGWRDLALGQVSISTVKRALSLLERAGLICVQRASGRKNVIEIVDEPVIEVGSEP